MGIHIICRYIAICRIHMHTWVALALAPSPTLYILIGPNGSVRLTGGFIPHQGNVEVCLSGAWSRVCGTTWNYKNSFVVCKQLGYPATQAGICIHNIIMKISYIDSLLYGSVVMLTFHSLYPQHMMFPNYKTGT